MGRKRERNRIPALPEAVKNLLALHSLEAWPGKHEEFPRGARAWHWRVIKAGDCHIKGKVLWTVKGNPSLDYWLQKVKLFTSGRLDFLSIDFESYSCGPCNWPSKDAERMAQHFAWASGELAKLMRFP